jgi:hypothetical protein
VTGPRVRETLAFSGNYLVGRGRGRGNGWSGMFCVFVSLVWLRAYWGSCWVGIHFFCIRVWMGVVGMGISRGWVGVLDPCRLSFWELA